MSLCELNKVVWHSVVVVWADVWASASEQDLATGERKPRLSPAGPAGWLRVQGSEGALSAPGAGAGLASSPLAPLFRNGGEGN